MNARDIIFQPVITEKSMQMLADGKYTFAVDPRANKSQIKRAIEQLFDVRVAKINTMNMQGKIRRMGRYEGKRADWKKAIVRLKGDDQIEFFEGMV
jgi:large subunit ribosomal protein L23